LAGLLVVFRPVLVVLMLVFLVSVALRFVVVGRALKLVLVVLRAVVLLVSVFLKLFTISPFYYNQTLHSVP